jgi:hypothetical protein
VELFLGTAREILTQNVPGGIIKDAGGALVGFPPIGSNSDMPGLWVKQPSGVPDTGSTLTLMTLTLMALGVAARQFKRAAA